DSLHYVHTVTRGNSSISAKIDSNEGALSGLMLRDTLKPNTRYIYFGADEHGKLVLQNRTRDSRHDFSDRRLSPLNAELEGYTVAEYPYISLVRDHSSQYVHAFVSADGEDWQYVT